MTFPELSRELNPRAVEDYFAFGYVPEPNTIFHNAYKLSPGYCITLRVGDTQVTPRRYWDLPFRPQAPRPEAEVTEELIARLQEAVLSQTEAEVPLGAFLSGGV